MNSSKYASNYFPCYVSPSSTLERTEHWKGTAWMQGPH